MRAPHEAGDCDESCSCCFECYRAGRGEVCGRVCVHAAQERRDEGEEPWPGDAKVLKEVSRHDFEKNTIDGHTCVKDDGGTPNRKCKACEKEKESKR